MSDDNKTPDGAKPTAPAPEATPAPKPAPPAKPVAPDTPLERIKAKVAADAAATKPEVKPEGTPEVKPEGEPEVKPEGEPEVKPEGESVTPTLDALNEQLTAEDEEYVNGILRDGDLKDKLAEDVRLWSTTFNPDTEAWLDHHRHARMAQIDIQNELNRKSVEAEGTGAVAAATTEGDGAGATLESSELQQIKIGRAIRSVANMDSDFNATYINEQNAKELLGVDPNQVPKKYAEAFEKLIGMVNNKTADADYFRKEGKQAFTKRDAHADRIFEYEVKEAMGQQGMQVEGGLDLVLPSLRKMAFANGQRRPWAVVLKEAAAKYPNILKAGTPATSTPAAATSGAGVGTGSTPAATPVTAPVKAPEGTRTTSPSITPAVTATKPKTYKQAAANVAARIAAATKK